MECSIKKSKKKKIAHRTDDEDDEVVMSTDDQSKRKKKAKKEFIENHSFQIKDDEIDTHSKKNKKKKKEHIFNSEGEELLSEELKRKQEEEFYHSDSIETKDDIEVYTSSKKKKKRKNDHLLSIIEDQFTEQTKNKKKSKKIVNQLDNVDLKDDVIHTPSKKYDKKKTDHNVEEVPGVSEQLKKKDKPSKEFNEIDSIHLQSSRIEHRIPPIHQEGIGGNSWKQKDYLELVKRMELQIPKIDSLSFSKRAEKLNWNQIQFGGHSIEECKERFKVLMKQVRHYRLISEVLKDAKTWLENPWTFSNRKVKHPEQPSRPLTSYMLFYMDKKNKIMKKHPNLKLTEISRLVGEKYNALSEQKKAYYVEKAKISKDEYKKNIIKFNEKYPHLIQGPVKKNVPVKKKKAVSSKPLTPFKLYLNDMLQKHQTDENLNRNDCIEKYRELWKTLSTKRKAFWIRLAKEEEDKYWEQLHYDEEDGTDHVNSYKSVLSKEENAILDRISGKPEKPPGSAYILFSRLMLQNKDEHFLNEEPKNRMKEVAIKWKELSEEQKKAYAEKVQHMNEIYKLEFANYLESLPEDKRAEELAKFQPKKRPVKLKQKNVKGTDITSSPQKELFKSVEPEKPPVTAWDLYKNEFIDKNSHLPNKIAYKKAAATWKTLSAKEIEKYKKKHEQIKEKYLVDFEAFIKSMSENELKDYALKGILNSSKQELNEESGEEESSLEDEENNGPAKSDSEESDSE